MSESGNGVGGGDQATREGRLVGGRYRLVRRLGAGGFGSVWQAHDEVLGVDVAVKEVQLPPAASAAEHDERLVRAQREAQHAARLRDHPNVVGVHDVVVDGGLPWTVMQLIVGRSLEDRIVQDGPLPAPEAARVAQAVLAALGAAHEAGIVHRDVKPANIMLADGGGVLLADFGIAVQQDQTALTASGMFIGSVDYLAPERAHGSPAAAAGDLFSLGATLYQAVEGRMPFRRDTPAATLAALLFETAPPMALAGPLAPLINGLLTKAPDDRLTGPQAAAMVTAFLQQQPAPPTAPPTAPFTATATTFVPPPPPVPPRAPAPARRWSPAYLLAPLGGLALYVGAVPLTGATLNGTFANGHDLAADVSLGKALGFLSFPGVPDTRYGILLAWPWLLLGVLALVCTALRPHRRHPVVRTLGYLSLSAFLVRLLTTDLTLRPTDFAPVSPTLVPHITISFGPGWWLLHAAVLLNLAYFVWQDVRTARRTTPAAV
ncbi:serine/threonine-protein kinase [Kitasatospora sp. NPDC059722]|uniref:serine/threonine-protein kinase n=1 Tax=unclassified Kitasatospora TaxID=2633591 RepID=UPI003686CF6E